MAIINRTLDGSEQQESMKLSAKTITNGNEFLIGIAERACTIVKASAVCSGASGAPTVALKVSRFGGASYFVGTTQLLSILGTSGPIGASLVPAAGSTQLNLQKNDVVTAIFAGGTGAAADYAVVDVVLQNIQDIKTWY